MLIKMYSFICICFMLKIYFNSLSLHVLFVLWIVMSTLSTQIDTKTSAKGTTFGRQ